MTYALIPDELPMRFVAARVPRGARWLYVELHAYCSRMLTDGIVDVPLAMLTDELDLEPALEHLIALGYVERRDEHYFLPKYLESNKRGADIERMREDARVRKERWTRHNLHDDHSICLPKRCAVRGRHDNGDHAGCSPSWCVPGNVPRTLRNDARYDSTRPEGSGESYRISEASTGAIARLEGALDAMLAQITARHPDARVTGDERYGNGCRELIIETGPITVELTAGDPQRTLRVHAYGPAPATGITDAHRDAIATAMRDVPDTLRSDVDALRDWPYLDHNLAGIELAGPDADQHLPAVLDALRHLSDDTTGIPVDGDLDPDVAEWIAAITAAHPGSTVTHAECFRDNGQRTALFYLQLPDAVEVVLESTAPAHHPPTATEVLVSSAATGHLAITHEEAAEVIAGTLAGVPERLRPPAHDYDQLERGWPHLGRDKVSVDLVGHGAQAYTDQAIAAVRRLRAHLAHLAREGNA